MKVKAIIFDGDGTTWHYPNVGRFGSSWDALSAAFGLSNETKKLLEFYYPKPELINEWTLKQAALFKGRIVQQAVNYMTPVPYTVGFRSFVEAIRGKVQIGLLTVGLNIPSRQVCAEIGLDFCLYNELVSEGERFTGEYFERVSLWAKARVLKEVLHKRGLNPQEVCYVGDSKSDVPCMKMVGYSFAFNPKDEETRFAAGLEKVIFDHNEIRSFLN
jgi:phosphoserine phosphatase